MKRFFTILIGLLAIGAAQGQMLNSTQFNTGQLPFVLTNLNGLFNAQFGIDSAGKVIFANGASVTNLIVRNTLTVPSGGTFQVGSDQYIAGQISRNGNGTGDFEISSATVTVDGTLTAGGLAGPGSGITSIAAGNISSGTLPAGRMPALTGDVTTSAGAVATTIGSSAVTYSKIQNVSATQRVLGRNTAGAGVVEEVTGTQILDWLGSTRGAVLYRGAGGWAILSPGTSGTFLQSAGAGADPAYAVPSGYTITLMDTGNNSMAANTTYYYGIMSSRTINTTYAVAQVDIPRAGTIKRVYYKIDVSGTTGTAAQNVTHTININNSTDCASSAFDYSSATINTLNSSVSQAVSQGDTIAFKVVTPATWTTPATSVRLVAVVYIE